MSLPKSIFFMHFTIAWRQCVRTNGLVGIFIVGVSILACAGLLASFSMRQPLIVALDLGISGIRVLGAFLALFWVQECFARDIERKTILGMFAYPVPKATYVLGRFSGLMAVALAALVFWGLGLAWLGLYADWGYADSSRPFVNWGMCLIVFGIWLDLITASAFMLLMVSLAETRLLPLFLGLGFTLAARGFGPMIDYLRFSPDADLELKEQVLPLLETIRWILPDLSRLDWREIALTGLWPDTTVLLNSSALGVSYIALLLVAATFAYQRREFS